MSYNNKIEFRIQGMTCHSCEVVIERKFLKIPGVKYSKVNHISGRVKVYCENEPKLQEFINALEGTHYNIIQDGVSQPDIVCSTKNSKRDYFEIMGVVVIIFGLYILLKQTD